MLRLRISACVAVTEPMKRPSKFSGVKLPNALGTSRSTEAGCRRLWSIAGAYRNGFSVEPGLRLARVPLTWPWMAASRQS